jgi:hypothetical protein
MAMSERIGTGKGIDVALISDHRSEVKATLTADGSSHEVWISKTDRGAITGVTGDGDREAGWIHLGRLVQERRLGSRFYSHLWGHEDFIIPESVLQTILPA